MPTFPTSPRWNANFQRYYPTVALTHAGSNRSFFASGADHTTSVAAAPTSIAAAGAHDAAAAVEEQHATAVPWHVYVRVYSRQLFIPLIIASCLLFWPVGLGSDDGTPHHHPPSGNTTTTGAAPNATTTPGVTPSWSFKACTR